MCPDACATSCGQVMQKISESNQASTEPNLANHVTVDHTAQ